MKDQKRTVSLHCLNFYLKPEENAETQLTDLEMDDSSVWDKEEKNGALGSCLYNRPYRIV